MLFAEDTPYWTNGESADVGGIQSIGTDHCSLSLSLSLSLCLSLPPPPLSLPPPSLSLPLPLSLSLPPPPPDRPPPPPLQIPKSGRSHLRQVSNGPTVPRASEADICTRAPLATE